MDELHTAQEAKANRLKKPIENPIFNKKQQELKQEHLGLFIRKLIGLDKQSAKRAFRDYLESKNLSANQIRFIDLIIDYLTQNGVMDASLLYEAPFTDYNSKGLDGVFSDNDAGGIVSILNSIREAAVA